MRFFPQSYHQYDDNKGVTIICFAYNENGDNIAIRFKYTYWIYASLGKYTHKELQATLSSLQGVYVEEGENAVQMRRSTIDAHHVQQVVRVHANTSYQKQELLRKLSNLDIKYHEHDNMLSPLLKMMAVRDIRMYQWMQVDVTHPLNKLSTCKYEYLGVTDTLCPYEGECLPPPFSVLSCDGEMDSDKWNKMPDAMTSDINAIRVWAYTFRHKDRYEEHAIILGPDVTPIYERYGRKDISSGIVKIHIVHTELDLIMVLFNLINTLNPDIIAGHNIIPFDLPYVLNRFRHRVLKDSRTSAKSIKSIKLPNISRLADYDVSTQNVEWNNSQVAIKGVYFDCPGRIWIDTYFVAARGLLVGGMKNNKLETLGDVILGMSKEAVSPKDMFRGFKIYRDWSLCKQMDEDPTIAKQVPFTKKQISKNIRELYEHFVRKHNITIPSRVQNPTFLDVNTILKLINCMDQRGKKRKLLTPKDKDVKALYLAVRSECAEMMKHWNIPCEEVGTIDEDTMIQVIWWLIVAYCLQDTRIPDQVIHVLDTVSILREQSSVFSVSIMDVLMRGQVYTVTNSQYRYNYQSGTMVNFGQPGGPTGAYKYGGGYVGKGKAGLKIKDDDTIIFVLDFASLYPTIIIAHNICYTTWIPPYARFPYHKDGTRNDEYIWLRYEQLLPMKLLTYQSERATCTDSDRCSTLDLYIEEIQKILDAPYEEKGTLMAGIHNVPNEDLKTIHEHWFIKASILSGVVPTMLWIQYLARKEIKGKMAAAYKRGDSMMGAVYNAQQLGTKTSMNATYGGYGTGTNRLANFPGAEVITYIGRQSIQECNADVERKGLGEVVYNDTDSAMIARNNITALFGRDIEKIKAYGADAAKELSKRFPRPMSLECENFFVAFLLKAPKMYAAIKMDGKSLDIADYTWQYVNDSKLMYIKGMAPVRRDKYQANRDLFTIILYNTLVRAASSILVAYVENALMQIWSLKGNMTKGKRTEEQWKGYLSRIEHLFAYNMGITTKSYQGGAGIMAKWCNIYEQKYGKKPIPGERYELLVSEVSTGPDAGKHTKAPTKLVTMEWFLEENRQLDVEHYILQLENGGSVIEIMNIAYPSEVPADCISKYYLRNLRNHNSLHAPAA